jgi:hypothetical protein
LALSPRIFVSVSALILSHINSVINILNIGIAVKEFLLE